MGYGRDEYAWLGRRVWMYELYLYMCSGAESLAGSRGKGRGGEDLEEDGGLSVIDDHICGQDLQA